MAEDINEILADVKQEGDKDPFASMEKDTPSESLPEKKQEEDKPKEGNDKVKDETLNTPEDKLPFHKHPRWIERENELKELKANGEATAKELAELRAFKEESTKKAEPTQKTIVPDWFKELYGDNQVAWQKYSEHEKQKEEELGKKFIEQQELQQQQAREETQKWNKWVDSEIGKLEAKDLKFDRNELIKIMLDYRPTDENGNFDFEAGYKIYDLQKPKDDSAKSLARKQLADTTTKTTVGEKKSKDYMTPDELRKKSWNQL